MSQILGFSQPSNPFSSQPMDPSPKRYHQSNDRNGSIEANCSKLHLPAVFPQVKPPPGRMSLGTWVVKPGRVRQKQPSLVGLPTSNESSNRNSWPCNWEPIPWTSFSWRWYLDSCIYHLLCLPFNRNDHLEGTCMMGSISKAVNAANTTKTMTKVMTWRDYAQSPFSIRDTASNCFFFSNFHLSSEGKTN